MEIRIAGKDVETIRQLTDEAIKTLENMVTKGSIMPERCEPFTEDGFYHVDPVIPWWEAKKK